MAAQISTSQLSRAVKARAREQEKFLKSRARTLVDAASFVGVLSAVADEVTAIAAMTAVKRLLEDEGALAEAKAVARRLLDHYVAPDASGGAQNLA
jgi:hypothetical protein